MRSGTTSKLEYQHRVNRVLDHIQHHRGEDLSLETLARVAAFSPFHFHRVFQAVTGENLKEFVQRVRLEWAGSMLVLRPHADVLEIALECGFQSASAFARAFKARFGMSATEWRSGGAEAWSKNRQAERNPGQALRKACNAAAEADGHSSSRGASDAPTTEECMNVSVKTVPNYRLAYVRCKGPYGPQSGIPQTWMRLQRWAAARDLWTPERLCLGIAHDNPHITAPEKCRYDACLVVPAGFEADAQVNVVDFPGGKFAVAPFRGTAGDIGPFWDRVFAEWLPQSGYQPDDRPCVEAYPGEAFDETTTVFTCELWTPVRPL
ncbi:AraC family transcriptional regulator [Polyangium aurulentum]|uniref:AraC family transcriptional regulator n=1 Tax=Polyangium aurulentum TaxID=2567896 RepID=UPI0010AEE10C|nr:GyrI-like domain-containing protein [Polyangium aurulentum]UQA59930.1 AraC family transcriptional regulator [Polyangium aurulentum]